MKNKGLIILLVIALLLLMSLGTVFASSLLPTVESTPGIWQGYSFLKTGMVMELESRDGDWYALVYYHNINKASWVDIPEELLSEIFVGQEMLFRVTDSTYASEWAGLNADAGLHYRAIKFFAEDFPDTSKIPNS